MDDVTNRMHDAKMLRKAKKLSSSYAGVMQRFAKDYENLELNETKKNEPSSSAWAGISS